MFPPLQLPFKHLCAEHCDAHGDARERGREGGSERASKGEREEVGLGFRV